MAKFSRELFMWSTVSFTLMRHTSRCRSMEPASVRGGTRFVGDERPGYIVTGCSFTIDSGTKVKNVIGVDLFRIF